MQQLKTHEHAEKNEVTTMARGNKRSVFPPVKGEDRCTSGIKMTCSSKSLAVMGVNCIRRGFHVNLLSYARSSLTLSLVITNAAMRTAG
ncbi:hypothetical protein MUK42_33669 [Musa troglodytarum]|nr:hypothetical protein MUK42_33669 [Musa troglodytarum]